MLECPADQQAARAVWSTSGLEHHRGFCARGACARIAAPNSSQENASMAGHSKWANIKHRKAAQDKQRGKAWTKLIREVTVAARESGGDPGANPRLRLAMDKAFAANMPRDTVERAIKRGAGGRRARTTRRSATRAMVRAVVARHGRLHDRQPQPHRLRCPACLHQARRKPGDRWLGLLSVCQAGCHQLCRPVPARTPSWRRRWRRAPRT